jgi:hypothetical protein
MRIFVLAAALSWSTLVCAADKDPLPDEMRALSITPVVLDGSHSTGATVGLQWKVNRNYYAKRFSTSDATGRGEAFPDFSKVWVRYLTVDYHLSGTATAEKERNPKNFLDAMVDAKLRLSSSPGFFGGGLFAKYETDQSFDNKQGVYGLRATYAKFRLIENLNDLIGFDVNLGQVDPSEDKARQAALGTSDLDEYYRWDLEFVYKLPLKFITSKLESIEVNYRYYHENSPPEAVRQAGLHRHYLGTAKLVIKNDLYIAYSRGKLPFDRESDKIFEVGWTHNLR